MEQVNNSGKRKLCKATAGYILGLVASSLSFIMCLFSAIAIFSFEKLFKNVFTGNLVNFFNNILMSDIFTKLGNFFGNILQGGIIFFWIIVVGFIIGFIGTIMSWNKSTILSSSIMIVGGIFSLFCLVFPGILLIIGGALNMKCAADKVN